MVPYLGDFAEDATVYIYFNTFTSNDPSASITATTLADTDIHVYKDGSETFIVTDGATVILNHDTGDLGDGVHLLTIDTSAHADYATGSEYAVRVEGLTVDAGLLNAVVGCFSIERAGGVLELMKATTLASIKAETALIVADTDVIDDGTSGLVKIAQDVAAILVDTADIQPNYATSTALATVDTEMAAQQTDLDTLTAGVALTAAGVDAIWDEDIVAAHGTADTAGKKLRDAETDTAAILIDTNELQTDDIPGKIVTLDAVVDTVKAETALIVADTNELQVDSAAGNLGVDVDKINGAVITGDGSATPFDVA